MQARSSIQACVLDVCVGIIVTTWLGFYNNIKSVKTCICARNDRGVRYEQ